jgi:hypothetical protein
MQRPSFQCAWTAAQRIVAPVNQSQKVARIIGGTVAKNIHLAPPHGWTNTCALRLSYVLNYSGVQIPQIKRKTVSGGDHRHYFFRVKDVIEFLHLRWGKPDLQLPFPESQQTVLGEKQGVVLFEVKGWNDANGHATLWNGSGCYDHCYFNEPGLHYRTERASFWALP